MKNKNKLKDLKVKSVSLVSNKSRPVNQYSKLTFVKSKEEEESELDKVEKKKPVMEDFFKSMFNYFTGKTENVELPAITEKAEKTDEEKPAEFVTKAEFETQFKSLGDKIDSLAGLLTKSSEVQKSEKESLGTFIQGFAEAYKADQEALKAIINEQIEKAKRAESPLVDQPSLDDIIKKALDPMNSIRTGHTGSEHVNAIVEKGIKEGRFKEKTVPAIQNSAYEALRELMGCNNQGGAR